MLCVVAAAIPLAILYLLYGPTRSRPLVLVPRSSMLAMPMPRRRARTSPEEAALITNVARLVPVVPRPPIPAPPPRTRQARGSDAPPRYAMRREDPTEPNPFADEGPTRVG